MIKIEEKFGLPFIMAEVTFRGRSMKSVKVLIDTGFAGTIPM